MARPWVDPVEPPPPATGFPSTVEPPVRSRRPRRGESRGGIGWLLALLLLVPLAVAAGWWARAEPGVLQFDTEMADFGEVAVGDVGRLEVMLRNVGSSPLTLVDVALSGEAAPLLAVDGAACLARPLEAEASCVLEVRFEPVAMGRPAAEVAGDARALLRVVAETEAQSRTLPLLARAVAPRLVAGRDALVFGEQVIGLRGKRSELELRNEGGAPLRIDTVSLAGEAAADFVRFADRCAGAVLAAGESCTTRFEFVPTAVGERLAMVTVRSADRPEPLEAARLSGLGLPAVGELAVEPAALQFTPRRVGSGEASLQIALSNEGDGALTDLRLRLEGVPLARSSDDPGADRDAETDAAAPLDESFRLSPQDCRDALPAGGRCLASVYFAPTASGERSATLVIEHADSTRRVPVTARAVAPELRLSAATVAFGDVPVGQTRRSASLVVDNPGTAPLTFDEIALEGDAAFALGSSEGAVDGAGSASEAACGDTLAAGGRCRLGVTFTPRREGPQRAVLRIEHDGGAALGPESSGSTGFRASTTVAISGIGVAARPTIEPSRVAFAEVAPGETARASVRLANAGRASLRVERVDLSNAEFSASGCLGRTLAGGEACTIELRFVASGAAARGPRSARLEIVTDAGRLDVPLTASVSVPAAPRLRVDRARAGFAETALGRRAPALPLRLENDGSAPLELYELEIEGLDAVDFALDRGTCLAVLPPRGACVVEVRFVPGGLGSRSATLTVRHDGEGGSLRVPLEGEGVAATSPN